ncbi:MAG: formate dehydrogenase [Alphaproteobacteria bacterium]|nr:MAG: formate dehydrogenase [Alphaproteobacteria bacterium]
MSPEKMVHMANQIAAFFNSQPRIDAAEGVAGHINDFWEPRMRRQLIDYVAAGGAGLDPSVRAAIALLNAPAD